MVSYLTPLPLVTAYLGVVASERAWKSHSSPGFEEEVAEKGLSTVIIPNDPTP